MRANIGITGLDDLLVQAEKVRDIAHKLSEESYILSQLVSDMQLNVSVDKSGTELCGSVCDDSIQQKKETIHG